MANLTALVTSLNDLSFTSREKFIRNVHLHSSQSRSVLVSVAEVVKLDQRAALRARG